MNVCWKQINLNLEPTTCKDYNLSLRCPAKSIYISYQNADGHVLFHILKSSMIPSEQCLATDMQLPPTGAIYNGLFSNRTLHMSIHSDSCV